MAGGLCSLSLSVRAEGREEGRVCSVTMQWSGSPLLLLLLLLTLVRGDNYFLLETYKDSADSQSGTVHRDHPQVQTRAVKIVWQKKQEIVQKESADKACEERQAGITTCRKATCTGQSRQEVSQDSEG